MSLGKSTVHGRQSTANSGRRSLIAFTGGPWTVDRGRPATAFNKLALPAVWHKPF